MAHGVQNGLAQEPAFAYLYMRYKLVSPKVRASTIYKDMSCPESKMPIPGCLHGVLRETAKNALDLSWICWRVKERYRLTSLQKKLINGMCTPGSGLEDLIIQIINGGRTFSDLELVCLLWTSDTMIISKDLWEDTVEKMLSESCCTTKALVTKILEKVCWNMSEDFVNNVSDDSETDTTSLDPINLTPTSGQQWANSMLTSLEQFSHLLQRDSVSQDPEEASKKYTKVITCPGCGTRHVVWRNPSDHGETEYYIQFFQCLECKLGKGRESWYDGQNWIKY